MPRMEETVIKPAVSHLIRGAFSMVMDEVRGSWRRRNDVGGVTIEMDELPPLPPLDETRLGHTIAPPTDAETEVGVPDDIFAPVVGMEHEIRVLRRVIVSEPPLHALIIGPPGTAKSLLLEEIRRCPDTRYIVGRNMTSAGLIEMFVDSDSPPRILLIDEIEKSDPNTLATLLTVMDGKATRAAHGKSAVERSVDVRIIAAGNSKARMPDALLNRFIELDLQPYTPAEREAVIVRFLETRHGFDAEQSHEIATMVAEHGGDTRDAYQIAQIWRNDPELAKEMAGRLGRTGTAPEPHGNRTSRAGTAAP